MSVANISSSIIADVSLDFVYDENLLHIEKHDNVIIKNGKFFLGNIYGGKSKTFTIYFEPLTCAKASDIRCQVNYVDREGNMASTFMEPKEISVVCPIMKTDQDINIGRLKELIEDLPFKDSRVYQLTNNHNIRKLVAIAREAVDKHDVKLIRTLYSRDGERCELWYYGKTKVNKDDIVINISIITEHSTIELFAATQTAEALTGLLAEIGRDLKQTLEAKTGGQGKVVNLTINDSVVQRSNLLSFCNMDGTCDSSMVMEEPISQHTDTAPSNSNKPVEKKDLDNEEQYDLKATVTPHISSNQKVASSTNPKSDKKPFNIVSFALKAGISGLLVIPGILVMFYGILVFILSVITYFTNGDTMFTGALVLLLGGALLMGPFILHIVSTLNRFQDKK
jgi:hypothetical protein